jgi:GT2 family glycosyltransferase
VIKKTIDDEIPKVSIVLPSYNRLDTLRLVIHALEKQNISDDQFEIIVSDDGSTDGTREFLTQYSRESRRKIKYILADQNGGPARARNLALKEAVGELIIIIGDDIVVECDFVEKHIQWHAHHNSVEEAVIGHVTWPESISPSRFMCWLYDGGRHFFFNYAGLNDGERIDCRNFYTCNVSIKSELLFKTELFDESFPYASHEDVELGERLGRHGMNLCYHSDIIGYHYHYLQIEGIVKRVYLMGRSAYIFWQKVSDKSHKTKRIARKVLIYFASLPGVFALLRMLLKLKEESEREYPFRWRLILMISYWLGFADAVAGKPLRTFQKEEI